MSVKPDYLRKLAIKLQPSPVTGALYESANYIETLEVELSELCPIADLPVINSLRTELHYMRDKMKEVRLAAEKLILEYENLYGCETVYSSNLNELIKDM